MKLKSNQRLQKSEPTPEEAEFLKQYGPNLGYVLRDWDGKCPEMHLRDAYYTFRYGSGSETPERNNHFEEDLSTAERLGLVAIVGSSEERSVTLTKRGEHLARTYV